MKINNSAIPLYFLSLVMFSCNAGKHNADGDTVNLADENGNISDSELIHVSRWIELDNNDQGLITNAKKVMKHNSNYYVFDNIGKKSIVVFDSLGNFVRTIGKIGNGPGEYVHAEDFCINERNGDVAILSSASFLYLYNNEGEFIERHKLSESLLWECAYMDGNYVFSTDHSTYTEGENAYLIYIFDESLKEVGKYEKVLPKQMPRLEIFNGQLVSNGNQLYYMDVFSNALISFDTSTLKPKDKIKLDFPSPMPLEIFAGGMTFFENQTKFDWIMGFVPTTSNLILNYVMGGGMNVAVLDCNGSVIKNGRFSGIFPRSFPTSSETIISPINLDEYFGYWSECEIYQKSGMPKLLADSNLLLLEWTLSEN